MEEPCGAIVQKTIYNEFYGLVQLGKETFWNVDLFGSLETRLNLEEHNSILSKCYKLSWFFFNSLSLHTMVLIKKLRAMLNVRVDIVFVWLAEIKIVCLNK